MVGDLLSGQADERLASVDTLDGFVASSAVPGAWSAGGRSWPAGIGAVLADDMGLEGTVQLLAGQWPKAWNRGPRCRWRSC